MEKSNQTRQALPADFRITDISGRLYFAGVCGISADEFKDDELQEYSRLAGDLDRLFNRIIFRRESTKPAPTLDLSPVTPFSADALRQLGS